MQLTYKPFSDLTTSELHDLLQLRVNVFVVEQDCPYPELDGLDKQCLHVLGFEGDEMMVYARILPPGLAYPELSFGRVLVKEAFRNKGHAHALMQYMLRIIDREFGNVAMKISAQTYLIGYYKQYGFALTGSEYLEDGLPHFAMVRAKK